jgi:hypothetical protein
MGSTPNARAIPVRQAASVILALLIELVENRKLRPPTSKPITEASESPATKACPSNGSSETATVSRPVPGRYLKLRSPLMTSAAGKSVTFPFGLRNRCSAVVSNGTTIVA